MMTSLARRLDARAQAVRSSPPPAGRCAPRAIEAALLQVRDSVHDTVLCVAGGYDMAMLVAAEKLGYRVIGARSEAGAAFTAASLAWDSGRPALVVVITSPGVYGTLQALHYAFVSRVPLLLLSGESSLAGSVQAGDGVGGPSVTRVTAPLTAWNADIARPSELPRALARAVGTAAATSRPVHLNIPTHVAVAEARP
jgi:thiamine pyrophosphate-dependent acetolactate synthase large subunit-like protein